MPDSMIDVESKTKFSDDRPLSQLLFDSPHSRVVSFGLEAGQEITPHVSDSEVHMLVFQGKGDVLIGETRFPAVAGQLFVCPPKASHGFRAEEKMIVLATITPRP